LGLFSLPEALKVAYGALNGLYGHMCFLYEKRIDNCFFVNTALQVEKQSRQK